MVDVWVCVTGGRDQPTGGSVGVVWYEVLESICRCVGVCYRR